MSSVDFPTLNGEIPLAARRSSASALPIWFWATCIVFVGALWCIDHDLTVIGTWDEEMGKTVEHAAKIRGAEWESGETARRLAFAFMAGWGAFLATCDPSRRPLKWQGLLAPLLVLYVVLCFASVAWSDQPVTTVKKLVTFACLLVAAVGIGRAFRPRELCLMVTLVTTALALVGVGSEMALGFFQPWSSAYRLTGALHPNNMGAYVAAACIGSFCMWHFGNRAPWWAANAALMICLSALTKSRMSLLALLVALLVVYVAQWSRVGIATAVTYLMTAIAGVLLFLGVADHATKNDVFSILVLKRKDEVASLTGRTPLWRELRPYVEARPLLGHGFAGFWSTGRHADIAREIEWPASHAHCAYLGAALELGLIGAATWAALMLTATWTAARRFRRTLDPGYAFLMGGCIFALMFSGTETLFFMVAGMPLILAPGLVQLALHDAGEEKP